MDSEYSQKIQELQVLERNLQSILMQKQALVIELSEIESALSEVSRSSDGVYKLTGSIMIKADKESVMKELEEKKAMLSLRINSIEKQENLIEKKAEEIKSEAASKIRKKDE